MLHEILLAVLGHSGSFIGPSMMATESNGDFGTTGQHREKHANVKPVAMLPEIQTFECKPITKSLLSQSECEAVNKIVRYGGHIKFLRRFVQLVLVEITTRESFQNGSSSPAPAPAHPSNHNDKKINVSLPLLHRRSIYREAAAQSIEILLHLFERNVCKMEREILTNGDSGCGLGHIQISLDVKSEWIPWVVSFIHSVLLESKWYDDDDDDGDDDEGEGFFRDKKNSCFDRIHYVSQGPLLLTKLGQWLRQCPTTKGNFDNIVNVNVNVNVNYDDDDDADSSSFSPRGALLHIQSSIHEAYINQIFYWMEHGLILDPFNEFFIARKNNKQKDLWGAGSDILFYDWNGSNDISSRSRSSDPEDFDDFILCRERLPPTIALTLGVRILFIGNAVRVIQQGNTKMTTGSGESTNERKEMKVQMTNRIQKEPQSLFIHLEHMVKCEYVKVSSKLYQLLLQEENNFLLLRHLNVFFNTFLLSDGQLITAFLDRCDEIQLWNQKFPIRGIMDIDTIRSSNSNNKYPDFNNRGLAPVLRMLGMWTDDSTNYNGDSGSSGSSSSCYAQHLSENLSIRILPAAFTYGSTLDSALFRFDNDLRLCGSGARHDFSRGWILLSSSYGSELTSRYSESSTIVRFDTSAILDCHDDYYCDGGGEGGSDVTDDRTLGDPSAVSNRRQYHELKVQSGGVYTSSKHELCHGFKTIINFCFSPPTTTNVSSSFPKHPSAGRRSGSGRTGKYYDDGILGFFLSKRNIASAMLQSVNDFDDAISSNESRRREKWERGEKESSSDIVAVITVQYHRNYCESKSIIEVSINGRKKGNKGSTMDLNDPDSMLTLTVEVDSKGRVTAVVDAEEGDSVSGASENNNNNKNCHRRVSVSSSLDYYFSLQENNNQKSSFHLERSSEHDKKQTTTTTTVKKNENKKHDNNKTERRKISRQKSSVRAHVGLAASGIPCMLRRWAFQQHPCPDKPAEMEALDMLAKSEEDIRMELLSTNRGEYKGILREQVHELLMRKLSWLDDDNIPSCSDNVAAAGSGSGAILSMDYNLPWPLFLVISRDDIDEYNRLFRCILRVQVAVHDLSECWRIMMGNQYRSCYAMTRENNNNNQRRHLRRTNTAKHCYTLFTRMHFVMSNILQYFKLDVAATAFHTMTTCMLETTHLDEVRIAHEVYLNTLKQRCFVDDKAVCNCLGRIYAIVLRFSGLYRAMTSNTSSSSPHLPRHNNIIISNKETERLSKRFDEELSKLFVLLENSDALELCYRLDFNGWFSSLAARSM